MSFPKTLTVTVTPDDIRKGRRMHSECCPVALALLRDLGDVPRVSVLPGSVMLSVGGTVADYTTSSKLRAWINEFDGRWPVEPIQATLTRISGGR